MAQPVPLFMKGDMHPKCKSKALDRGFDSVSNLYHEKVDLKGI
jgi:hypothetical protein